MPKRENKVSKEVSSQSKSPPTLKVLAARQLARDNDFSAGPLTKSSEWRRVGKGKWRFFEKLYYPHCEVKLFSSPNLLDLDRYPDLARAPFQAVKGYCYVKPTFMSPGGYYIDSRVSGYFITQTRELMDPLAEGETKEDMTRLRFRIHQVRDETVQSIANFCIVYLADSHLPSFKFGGYDEKKYNQETLLALLQEICEAPGILKECYSSKERTLSNERTAVDIENPVQRPNMS